MKIKRRARTTKSEKKKNRQKEGHHHVMTHLHAVFLGATQVSVRLVSVLIGQSIGIAS